MDAANVEVLAIRKQAKEITGILAALRLAEREGVGQVVDASLMGTAAWTMAQRVAPQRWM